VVVRENLEDLYVGIEGDLADAPGAIAGGSRWRSPAASPSRS
jgi:hypothetical protein